MRNLLFIFILLLIGSCKKETFKQGVITDNKSKLFLHSPDSKCMEFRTCHYGQQRFLIDTTLEDGAFYKISFIVVPGHNLLSISKIRVYDEYDTICTNEAGY